MTEDVITDLARYKDLLVIARNSTLAYKGKPVDARQVAKDLNVRYVLTGSIQHQADQLRVTAELIDAATGAQVWSERWDRPAQDLFSVQAEVADKVAASLGGNGGSNLGRDPRTPVVGSQAARPGQSFRLRLLLARPRTTEIGHQGRERERARVREAIEFARPSRSIRTLRLPMRRGHGSNLQKALAVRSPLGNDRSKEFESDLRLALALDPSNADAHAGLIRYLRRHGPVGRIVRRDRSRCARQSDQQLGASDCRRAAPLPGTTGRGRRHGGLGLAARSADAGLGSQLLIDAYFFGRKFERAIEVSDQIPDEQQRQIRSILSGRKLCFSRPRRGRGARQGRPHRQKRRAGVGDMVQRRRSVCADERAGSSSARAFASSACASAPLRRSSRNSTTRSACRNASKLEGEIDQTKKANQAPHFSP